ncbi:hypothetical protein E2C01_094336 [Portunus trituberculatus]|uniref:Uncharacterized protein n=1 Tax=Portunus trituberculatus TaxID=210409 RepID=A0A5B7K0H6_PORTR|nr:hypothetical protein [Portunus trituberculatus]
MTNGFVFRWLAHLSMNSQALVRVHALTTQAFTLPSGWSTHVYLEHYRRANCENPHIDLKNGIHHRLRGSDETK